jgi:DNA-binding transcriptional regulator YiaG
MTSLAMTAGTSTSAAGAMLRGSVGPVLLGLMLSGTGTSSARAAPEETVVFPLAARQTSSGAAAVVPSRAGASIAELRRLSGLSWEQLAHVFGVSRRSLHFWASGKAMAPSNEEHLQRLLAALRQIDRGSASTNRSALLAVQAGGELPLDLLADGQYQRVVALLGSGEARRVVPAKLSAAAEAARAPRPPDELLGALQDRVHPASGRLLGSKPMRIVRSK